MTFVPLFRAFRTKRVVAGTLLLTSLTAAAPQSVVDAERAFAADAQVLGQWTAFRNWAAQDALLFVPEAVNAQLWLKGRPDPKVAPSWQLARVSLSCDGYLAHSMGPTLRDAGRVHGYFSTIWRKQSGGRWEWVYDYGQPVEGGPIAAGPQPNVAQASCENLSAAGAAAARFLAHFPPKFGQAAQTVTVRSGMSPDATLIWFTYGITGSTRLPQLKGAYETTVLRWNGHRHELAGKDLINFPQSK